MVAFDIDGTLLPRGVMTLDAKTKEALDELNKKGIYTVISTGRIVTFIQDEIMKKIDSDYYVTINGSVVTDKDLNVIKTYPLKEEGFKEIIDAVLDLDIAIGLKYPKEIAVYNRYDYYMSIYDRYHNLPPLIYDYSKTRDYHLTHGLPTGAFIIAEEEKIPAFKERIKSVTVADAYKGAAECYDKDISKAEALAFVANRLGFTMDNVMAFGDSQNDIDMLKAAKVGVAMGNATEATKAIADYVTDDCNKYGIPKALRHFGLIDR